MVTVLPQTKQSASAQCSYEVYLPPTTSCSSRQQGSDAEDSGLIKPVAAALCSSEVSVATGGRPLLAAKCCDSPVRNGNGTHIG